MSTPTDSNVVQPAVVTPAGEPNPTATPVAVPTPDVIAAAVQAGLQAHAASVQSTPKEMTPEERNEYLQVFDPNADGFLDHFVAAITDSETTAEDRAKAIEHLRDGIANQSIRGAQLLIDTRVRELEAKFAPVLQRAEQQKAEELWNTFATKYPDLKEHRGLVDAVSIQLVQGGFIAKNLDEAFTRAAETTYTLLGKTVPVANNTAPTQMPRMSQTNTSTAGGVTTPQADNPIGVASFFQKRRR